MTSLVALCGLRACPRGCAGRCSLATTRGDGKGGQIVVPSAACEMMGGAPPVPGGMPVLTHHTVEQLRVMAAPGRDADPRVRERAGAELRRRGL